MEVKGGEPLGVVDPCGFTRDMTSLKRGVVEVPTPGSTVSDPASILSSSSVSMITRGMSFAGVKINGGTGAFLTFGDVVFSGTEGTGSIVGLGLEVAKGAVELGAGAKVSSTGSGVLITEKSSADKLPRSS